MSGNVDSSVDTPSLNIAEIATHTNALGPGNRAVIWVQGCPFNCPGCIAPNWIPFSAAKIFIVEELAEKLDLEILDGLTFSGGEPMHQAAGLADLARIIRKKKDVDIICFTGYRYQQLLISPPNSGVKDLLSVIDVLIDGPYVQSKNNSQGLRGSTNQRIIHLTTRLKDYDFETQKRRVEVTVQDGELRFVGIPTPAIKSAIELARLAGAKG